VSYLANDSQQDSAMHGIGLITTAEGE